VLRLTQRGHSSTDTEKAARLIRDHGFNLGLQMMIGLPGDSLEKSIGTAEKIIGLGAVETRIYPTLVIKGTKLEELFQQGYYKPLTLDEAVDWSAKLVTLFEENGINVLKVGLHPSESLMDGNELVAGPFHPSFRELVLTEIWRDILQPLCTDNGRSIEIVVSNRELNHAVGYNGQNKKMLLKNFEKVRLITNALLKGRDHKISIAA
ncbi:MAG: hypothetical protein ACNA7V_12535, partial [Bacteroidales bacterium]